MLTFIKRMVGENADQRHTPPEHARKAKEIREHFSEAEIDKILKDTFPASDPPAWY